MNWSKSIIAVFIFFALFIGILVSVCMRQDISLVSADYYKDELAYQDQIDRLNNTQLLSVKPTTQFVDGKIEVRFAGQPSVERGVLTLFRPSDARSDRTFELNPGADSIQRFDIGGLAPGMYKAKMLWVMSGKEYYVENILNY